MQVAKKVVGRWFSWWLVAALLTWMFVFAAAYATYVSDPDYARDEPLEAFSWLVFPGLIAVLMTWAVWSDYSWLIGAKRLLRLIVGMDSDSVVFSSPIKARPGMLIVNTERELIYTDLKSSIALIYNSKFEAASGYSISSEHRIPEGLLGSACIIGNPSQGYIARLPALEILFNSVKYYVIVIDPLYVSSTRGFEASIAGAKVTVTYNGYTVDASLSAYLGATPHLDAWLECVVGGVKGLVKIARGQRPPARVVKRILDRPLLLVVPEGMEEPPQLLKAADIKEFVSVGGSCPHYCKLKVKVSR